MMGATMILYRVRRILALVPLGLALALAGCSDGLFHPDAEAPSARFGLIVPSMASLSEGVEASIQQAFARVNRVRVRVWTSQSETPLVDEVAEVTSSTTELRLSLKIPLEAAEAGVIIRTELLRDALLLFDGEQSVTLRRGAATDVQITPEPVASGIALPAPPPPLRYIGATVDLGGTPVFATGDPITGRSLSWSSLDPGVASVTSAGRVTAVGQGAARLRAQAGGFTADLDVAVALEVTTVDVTPPSFLLVEWDATTFTAVARDAGGTAFDAGLPVWISGSTSVAMVDAAGRVTAQAEGETTIFAEVAGIQGGASLGVVTAAWASPGSVSATHTVGSSPCPQNLATLVLANRSPSPLELFPLAEPFNTSITGGTGTLLPGQSLTATVRFTCDAASTVDGVFRFEYVRLDVSGYSREVQVPVFVNVVNP